MVQHREVLAPEVLAATEPVDRARAAVLVELLGEQLASPDVQHERDAGLGQTGPDRLEIHVRRREGPWRFGWQPDGGDTEFERSIKFLDRAARLVQREVADGKQPLISAAELGHRPVQRPGAAVAHIRIIGTGELPERERREHQLRVNAERVEHPRAHARIERTRRPPSLRARDDIGADLLAALPLPQPRQRRHQCRSVLAGLLEAEGTELLPHVRLGVAGKPVLHLHHVAVRIEDHWQPAPTGRWSNQFCRNAPHNQSFADRTAFPNRGSSSLSSAPAPFE